MDAVQGRRVPHGFAVILEKDLRRIADGIGVGKKLIKRDRHDSLLLPA